MARERPELSRARPSLRLAVIIYTVDEDGGVLIVRVRHGREDWADMPESPQ